jgi:prepilin-type processing-associated H-X9-DG protein/prepilin-type N-terminal cleavage/methylation domain-containing protein
VGGVTLMRSALLFGIAFFIYCAGAVPRRVDASTANESMSRSIHAHTSGGFTLAELLVTLGIIGVLVGVLVPVTSSVRQSARTIECASNMRQVSTALIAYASASGGVFPPNSGQHQLFWYQSQHIGGFLSSELALTDGTLARGVLLCPNDMEDALRSFSMNLYASGLVSDSVAQKLQETPTKHGKLFRLGSKDSARVMLLIESWSEMPQPLNNPIGHASQAVVGLVGKPGQRFGGGTGIVWTDPPDATPGRFDTRASQIAFNRHRRTGGQIEAPRGSANFAFLDGHVQLLRQEELVDNLTGISRFNAMWSEIDHSIESAP